MPKFTDDQKNAIYTSGNNIIVSAGAGSGKTAVLSERILEKIKSGVSVDSLLVLTFTEAAAYEMKSRIKDKVAKDALVAHKASEIDSAYITTFDSYALSIVKKYHYLLGIDKNINIIDKSIISLYKKNTLDEIFEDYYKQKNTVFLEMISRFCTKNDKLIKEEILEIDNKLDLKLNKEEYLDSYESKYLKESLISYYYDEFENYILDKVALSREYYDLFIDNVDPKKYEEISNYFEEYFNASCLEDLLNILAITAPQIRNLDEESTQYKNIFKKITSDIKAEIQSYSLKKDLINNFNLTKEHFKIIIEILKELNNRVNDYKHQNLYFDFADIAKMSINCLKNNPLELEKLKYSLNEILLDEYQDTNDLQEEFISLIANKNVYMVGDIKQSIYRFRNANPSIFMNKYETYKRNDFQDGIKIDLMKNFRSRQEVVNAINLIFNPLMSLTRGGADYKKDHIMHFGNENYNNGGKVESQSFNMECPSYIYDKENNYDKDPSEIEIFFMAKDIINKINNNYLIMDKNTNLARNCSYKDFAILIDKSKNFELITRIFNYFNIPIEIIKNDDLTSNSLIYTFSNILNLIYLENESDYSNEYKLSYMSVARSFIINNNDNELLDIILNNNINNTSLFNKIKKLTLDLEIKSNKMLIEDIINEFNIIDKLSLIGDIEQNLMRIEYIYNLADNYSNLNLNGILFINKLKEILDSNFKIEIEQFSTNVDSVKLMTIHKSKGLEYPIVYLPFLTSKFFNSDNTSKFLYSQNYEIILPYINEEKSLLKHLHLVKEKEETLSEKIRLFYVALTRARDKLIIIRQNPSSENDLKEYTLMNVLSLNSLLNCIGKELTPYTYLINVEDLNITKEYNFYKNKNLEISKLNKDIIHKNNFDNSKIIEAIHSSKETKELIDSKTLDNMQYGTKIHEIMESIDLINPDFTSIEPWMIKHIKYFLSLDILKNIENAKIYKEYEFTFEDDKVYHGIIDLLIEFENKIIIIDYKLTDIENKEYIKQLSTYKDYIKSLNTNKEIHMYLFSFLENKVKEI